MFWICPQKVDESEKNTNELSICFAESQQAILGFIVFFDIFFHMEQSHNTDNQ